MIKANDLRIGNLVNNPKGNGYSAPGFVKVASISSKGINDWQDMGASGYAAFEDLYPIPLTPEILRKADVSNFPFELFYVGGRYHIALENGNWVFIESLHHLQNLYSPLTGEELQINL